MNKLNFPKYNFSITREGNTLFIFDEIRKKRLVLTPEEWVRQNLIKYLILEKGYPKGLISLEAGLKINSLRKRYDALIFDREKRPHILIECKAPSVKINESVFKQILTYNMEINASYMMVSNGLSHFFLKKNPEEGKFTFLSYIPGYKNILPPLKQP